MLFQKQIFRLEGKLYRLLKAFDGDAWVIDIEDESALPERMDWTLLQYVDAELLPSVERASKPSAKREQACVNAWNRIKPLIEWGDALFHAETRHQAIKDAVANSGGTVPTYYKLLRRFWQRGMVKDALMPDYNRCGRPNRARDDVCEPVTQQRGRRKADGSRPYQLTHVDLAKIEKAAQSYFNDERTTLAKAYQDYLTLNFTVVSKSEAHVALETPSYDQFRREVHRLRTPAQILKSRKGRGRFEKDYRGLPGTVMLDTEGVGSMSEFDMTVGDITLVDESGNIIGKPNYGILIDVSSRLIHGYYVGLEDPSWATYTQILLSCFVDKEELCQRLNIPYKPADWPADKVVPCRTKGDRGPENISLHSDQCAELGTSHAVLPSCRPDWKPVVERGLGVLGNRMSELPAYDPPENFMNRQPKKYSKEACITLPEFERYFVRQIILHNHCPMPSYPLSIEQLNDGVNPTPIDIWNHGIETRMGMLSTCTQERAREILLVRGDAIVTSHGVEFDGICYRLPNDVENELLVKARRQSFGVQVRYDKRLVDTIDAQLPDGRTVRCELGPRSLELQGMSFAEVELINKRKAAISSKAKADRHSIYALSSLDTKQLVLESKRRQSTLQKPRRSSRKADVKEDRKEVLKMERMGTVLMPPMKSQLSVPLNLVEEPIPDCTMTAKEVDTAVVNAAANAMNRLRALREKQR